MPDRAEFAGALRHRLIVERPTEGTGDARPTYATVATVWAEKLGLAGRKVSGLEVEADYRLRIRFRQDIQPTDRLRDGTQVLEILSVLDLAGDRRELTLLVRAKAA